jgi:hypothetical protein
MIGEKVGDFNSGSGSGDVGITAPCTDNWRPESPFYSQSVSGTEAVSGTPIQLYYSTNIYMGFEAQRSL